MDARWRGAWAVLLGAAAWALFAGADDNGLRRLTTAYPDQFSPTDKPNTLLWRDGTKMPYDDGVVKGTFDEVLKKASPKDQMSLAYPCGWPTREPGDNEDPGRIRCEPLFRKMYGGAAAAVEESLVAVPWPAAGKEATLKFTRVNGAAAALEAVGAEVEALPEDVRRYAAKPIGTFNWRVVAGEDRLSPHSYGIAVDFQLPARLHRYWRWDVKGDDATPSYPREAMRDERLGQIVTIFERHGFIWGGKWRHYDTMHFEYRPELAPPQGK